MILKINRRMKKCKINIKFNRDKMGFSSLLFLLFFLFGISGYAQDVLIKGKVQLKNDQSLLPGVNVVIKGKAIGTVTDIDGEFKINASKQDVLVISYLGFISQEIGVNNQTSINVFLEEDTKNISEVVVVGYGTMKKSDMTGAVTSIKAEDMSVSATANVTQMMQGKASGVQIVQQSAQPGGGLKVLIRGQSSTNTNNEPLYVIDGFPIYNEKLEPESGTIYHAGSSNPLNSLNPNDIESIEVLKDASSTAIYGARAANGVILITTKRGKDGVKVSFSSRYSVQKISSYSEMLTAEEFMEMYDIHRKQFLYAEKGIYPYGTKEETPTSYKPKFTEEVREKIYANVGKKGTNWFDEVTRAGYIKDNNLSISGGTPKTKYFSSLNYYDQQGVVINSGFKRFSGRLNVDQEITKNIKTGISITGSQITKQNAALGNGYWERMGAIGSALGFPSIYSVYDTLGNYTENELYTANPNPVSYGEIKDNTIEQRWMGSSFLELNIIDGLTFRSSVGFDMATANRSLYLPKTFKYGANENGVATHGINSNSSTMFDAVFNYRKTFGEDNSLSAFAGYSFQQFGKEGISTKNSDFFTDAFGANRIQAGASVPVTNSFKEASKMASYFGRVNYAYQSKYLLTFTGRYDGSDRFGANNKYGFFPSAALGWNMAKENFMESVDFLNELKIRLSIGQTGNSEIGGNAFAYYGPQVQYQFGNAIRSGMVKTQQENPNLKWETSTEKNIGLDFGIFKNRIYGSFEFFDKIVSDLLYSQRQQIYQQVSNVYMNVGKTQTRGIEFNVNAKLLTRAFKWTTSINASTYQSKWLERAPDAITNLDPNVAVNDYMRPLYYFEADHIMQIGETAPYGLAYIPGNLIVKDLNSWQVDENGKYILDANGRKMKSGKPDGKIDDADKKFFGTYDPKLIFGFGNNFSYKGFELSLFFHGMYNYWVNNNSYSFNVLRTEFLYGGFNRSKEYLDTWTPENPDGKVPAAVQNHSQQGYDTYKFQKISFIRLRNVTLGYNIPSKIWGTSIKVYVDGNNLFTLSNLKDMDPETITYEDGASQYQNTGGGLYAYPNQRTFTLGVTVDF